MEDVVDNNIPHKMSHFLSFGIFLLSLPIAFVIPLIRTCCSCSFSPLMLLLFSLPWLPAHLCSVGPYLINHSDPASVSSTSASVRTLPRIVAVWSLHWSWLRCSHSWSLGKHFLSQAQRVQRVSHGGAACFPVDAGCWWVPRKVREAPWIFRRVHFHPGSGDLENVSKTLTVAPIFHFSFQNIPWGVPRTLLFTQHSGSRLPVLGLSPVPPVYFWEVMSLFHDQLP